MNGLGKALKKFAQSRSTSIGNEVIYAYDGNNQVISVQINDEPVFKIQRDADGFTARETMAGHLKREYEYSEDGLLICQQISNANYGYLERSCMNWWP